MYCSPIPVSSTPRSVGMGSVPSSSYCSPSVPYFLKRYSAVPKGAANQFATASSVSTECSEAALKPVMLFSAPPSQVSGSAPW